MNIQMYERIRSNPGFIAALDQSGGSTPKALELYGISTSSYSNEAQMFDLVHQMRTRIITSPSFTSEHILAVILFEATLDRMIEGLPTAQYLWQQKGIPSFLKIDQGVLSEVNGARLMKPIPNLSTLLNKANANGVVGTKARSIIDLPNATGIEACVRQQFELAEQVFAAGLIPIIEPEVDINSTEKKWIECILKRDLLANLDALDEAHHVILKLTIPSQENYYLELIEHPRVLKVVALSGGYSRTAATELLSKNDGMIASFSRALTEGLTVNQSEAEFNLALENSIRDIYQASMKTVTK